MKSIHFICRGNIYRSRLAEAYAKSLVDENEQKHISSSGIEANLDHDGAVSDVVPTLLMKDNIEHLMKPHWTQTTQELLDENDIIVFVTETVYRDAKKFLTVNENTSVVWNIPDVDGIYPVIKKQVEKIVQETV